MCVRVLMCLCLCVFVLVFVILNWYFFVEVKLCVVCDESVQVSELCWPICTVQNLSNGIPFGEKEQHMLPLNDFLDSNNDALIEFFEDLIHVEDVEDRMEVCFDFVCFPTHEILIWVRWVAYECAFWGVSIRWTCTKSGPPRAIITSISLWMKST